MIIDFYGRNSGGGGGGGDVTKAEVKRMISSAFTEYSEDIEAGDPIVGLAKNLYSPDGVTNQDTFIMRTTAGDDSVSTGVAYLKQVKGRTIATEPVYAGVYGTFVPTDRFTVVFTGDTSTTSSTTYTYSNGVWDGDVSDFIITGLVLDGDEFTLTVNEASYYSLTYTPSGNTNFVVTYDGSLDDNVGETYSFNWKSQNEEWEDENEDPVNIEDYGLSVYGTLETGSYYITLTPVTAVATISYNRVTRVNPTISINSETYEAEAGETGTTVFSYDGSDWTPGLTAYGITVTGDIYDGDGISVLYTGSIYTPMQDTTPTSFTALGLNSFDKDNPTTKVIDGVTYYIVKAVGGLADGYVIYGGSGATITGGVADSANASAITTTTGATTLVVNPTTGATYIYFTTTGSIDDVCVHPQWSGYMNEAYEAYSESTVVLPTKDTNGHALPALISVGNVGNIMDIENGIFTQYVESIPATEELIQQYRTGKTWGVDYVFDSNHIYQVLDTPVEIPMEETINAYNENDFSVEYYNGTSVAVPTVCYYMTNLVDKLRVDVLTRSNIVRLTQSQYDNLETKDPNTQYIITDANAVDMDSYKDIVDCTEDGLPDEGVEGKLYLYNGRCLKWVDGAGNWGEWIEGRRYDNYPNYLDASLKYGVIPTSLDGQVLFVYRRTTSTSYPSFYAVYNATAQTITMKQNDAQTGTTKAVVNLGDVNTRCECDTSLALYVTWKDGLISITNSGSYPMFFDLISTSIQVGHWESVDDKTLASRSFVDASQGQPIWNKQGVVIGKTRDINSCYVQVNPSSQWSNYIYFLSETGGNKFTIFTPTVGGNGAGYILQSGGQWAAPTWVSLASMMGGLTIWCGTEDEYEAIATKDSNTLYIIRDE